MVQGPKGSSVTAAHKRPEGAGVTVVTLAEGVRTHTLIGPGHNHSRVLERDGTINISQSKIKTWRQCHRQYHYKFVELLKKKRVKRPFTFGGIVHQMIEAHAEGDDPFEKLDEIELEKGAYFRREIEMYGDIIEDLRHIMKEYFDYWGDSMVYVRKNKRSSEHEFRIELLNGLWFTGRIDAVGKAKKMRWVVEHKTFSRMPSEDDRWRSVQAAVYFRALQIMGWQECDGVLWDYISSKPPMVPELLKNGKMSQKRLVTLPSKLREYIRENNLDKKDYAEYLKAAAERRNEYFIRLYNPVKRPVVDMVWEDFLETAVDIADNHGKKKARNIGRHCTWCDYEGLCRAEMQGSDVDFLIGREYVREDDDHAETGEED
jgi:hypothetical protein